MSQDPSFGSFFDHIFKSVEVRAMSKLGSHTLENRKKHFFQTLPELFFMNCNGKYKTRNDVYNQIPVIFGPFSPVLSPKLLVIY